MEQTANPTTAEPLETPAMVVAMRRQIDGKFVKGTAPGPGRKAGIGNRFAEEMKKQVMLWIQNEGTSANPLMIAAQIAKRCFETDPAMALKAADLICRYTMPRVTELTGKDGGPLRFGERERDVSELAKDPAVRAIIEAAEEKLNHED
jgi:hypothetical protein